MRWKLFIIMAVMLTGSAFADPFVPFQPDWSSQVKITGPAMDKPENKGKEFYSEWWAVIFRPKNGYYAYVRFMIYNLGPGDEKLKVNATFETPDKTKYSVTRTFSRDDWKTGKGLAIDAEGNVLRYTGKAFVIKLKNKKFTADLRLTPRFGPWKPGNGRIRYGKHSDYYALDIPLPLGDLHGEFTTLKDGKKHKVSGIVYMDHQAMNSGMHNTTKNIYRFRQVDNKKMVFMASLTPPKQFGDHQATCMAAFLPGDIIQAVGMQVHVKSWWNDPKEGGYTIPKILSFSGKTSDGKPLRGAILMKKFSSRDDFLKGMNRVERFIVSKFAKPIDYSFDAVMAVEVGTGQAKKTFKTKGTIFFTGVNH